MTLLISDYFEKNKDYKAAENIYRQAILLNENFPMKQKKYIAILYSSLAGLNLLEFKIDEALINSNKALSIREKLDYVDRENLLLDYKQKAYILSLKRDYKNSIEYYNKAENIINKQEDKYYKDLSDIYQQIAFCYSALSKDNKKIINEYSDKAIILLEKYQSKVSVQLLNLVLHKARYNYLTNKDYTIAQKEYEKFVDLYFKAEKLDNPLIYLNFESSTNNLAELYSKTKQHDKLNNLIKKLTKNTNKITDLNIEKFRKKFLKGFRYKCQEI